MLSIHLKKQLRKVLAYDVEINPVASRLSRYQPLFFRCGGRLRNSIYSASDRILGLHLVKNARLPVLKPVTISGNLTNGKNVTFTFELGDGSLSLQPADQPQIRHIYDQPGSYIVSMEATNPVTGSITVSEVRETKPQGNQKKRTNVFFCWRWTALQMLSKCLNKLFYRRR